MFSIQLNVALKAPLVGDNEKTTESPSIWREVSDVSSSVDWSKRLGDHLLRSAFPKAR